MFFSHYNLIISSLSNWLITDVTSVVPAMAREGWYAIVNCLTEQSLLISFTPSFTLVLTYSQSSNPIPALIGSNCLNPGLWLVVGGGSCSHLYLIWGMVVYGYAEQHISGQYHTNVTALPDMATSYNSVLAILEHFSMINVFHDSGDYFLSQK